MATQLVGHLPVSVFTSYRRCLFLIYTSFIFIPAAVQPRLKKERGKKQVSLWEGGWVGESQLEREKKTERIFYSVRMMCFFFPLRLSFLSKPVSLTEENCECAREGG